MVSPGTRDEIIDMLQDTELGGIYFYCHAVSDGDGELS